MYQYEKENNNFEKDQVTYKKTITLNLSEIFIDYKNISTQY
jgi:hypothetical protein